jgi:peptidoglycan/LPS O-acetylase OafA/YrhL
MSPEPARRRSSSGYYPGIEGLRAVAVMAVLLYHLDARWAPAGFIGVDIFFVISGFVVSLSVAHFSTASFASFIARFYDRRLKRIAPALLVCLAVVALLSVLFIPRAVLSQSNAKTGLAAFFGLSNIVLARIDGDYFSARTDFNPFTHTWSLGVEEQFYLIAPLLLYFWVRAAPGAPARRRASATLAFLGLASLAWCAWSTTRAPTQAFYGLPSRLWELACGVGLFFTLDLWKPRLRALPRWAAEAGTLAFAGGVGLSLWITPSDAFPFPGVLLPALATTGLIACVVSRDGTLVGRALSLPAMRYLGRISYSLYLWHWPVFVLFRWTVDLEHPLYRLCAAALALSLAALSYRFVEAPVRAISWARLLPTGRVALVGVASLALTCTASWAVFKSGDSLSLSVTRDASIWRPDGHIHFDEPERCALQVVWKPLAVGSITTYRPKDCALQAAGRLFVVGDSHAGAYSGMVLGYAARTGHETRLMTLGGCPFVGLRRPDGEGLPECRAFSNTVLQILMHDAKAGDVLFLPSLRVNRLKNQWGAPEELRDVDNPAARGRAVAEGLRMLAPLAQRHVTILFEAPKPVFLAPPFRCSDWFNRDNPICAAGPTMPRSDEEQLRRGTLEAMTQLVARLPGAGIWDPLPVLCPERTCDSWRDGKPLYFDGNHLSGFGNAQLLPSFTRRVNQLWAADIDR